MPELPEVETTVRGLRPHLEGLKIAGIVLRRPDLRWPIPREIHGLVGAHIQQIARRAKYILMHTERGTAIWHLGMSGTLRVVDAATPVRVHDHVDVALGAGSLLRFHDPRRFGCLMFQAVRAASAPPHPLLAKLGPEPLTEAFTDAYLFQHTRKRSQAIKHFLMDQAHVVGVGNIYAAEALFRAGVRPSRQAGRVTREECIALVLAIKTILAHAIERGGTTLRDFLNADGNPGYFEQELFVYDREGELCRACASVIRAAKLGVRQSMYCPQCQR
jgi:formamidopyrimidine-DNA glycosylase